jgi:FkbM family methyltransferase
MIKPIAINCGGRGVEFMMDLDPSVVADAAISWYLQKGVPCEPEVVHLMSRVVQPGDVAVDCGANVGFFTLLLAQYVGPTGVVLAVEPGTNNLPKLKANIALNKKATNVQLYETVLASRSGPIQFHLAHDSGANARWANEVTTLSTMELPATTLDALCTGVPKLVKMDIEGSELDALEGAEALLVRHPPYIVLELNEPALTAMGATPDDIRHFMRQRGYEMFVLSEYGLLPAMVPWTSHINVSRNNTNVLFSTLADVAKAWPEVIV